MEKTTMDAKGLNNKLKEIRKQIAELQDKCMHKEQTIKVIGNNNIRWVCSSCKKALTWPSPEELTTWTKS